MTELTALEKKMGTTWEKLNGHLCCEPCHKHFVMALAPIEDPLQVVEIQKTLLFKSMKKKLPKNVDDIFARKVKTLMERKNDNKKDNAS
jgi:hypothetical protein